jgi:hypothetical protein
MKKVLRGLAILLMIAVVSLTGCDLLNGLLNTNPFSGTWSVYYHTVFMDVGDGIWEDTWVIDDNTLTFYDIGEAEPYSSGTVTNRNTDPSVFGILTPFGFITSS